MDRSKVYLDAYFSCITIFDFSAFDSSLTMPRSKSGVKRPPVDKTSLEGAVMDVVNNGHIVISYFQRAQHFKDNIAPSSQISQNRWQ